MGQSESKSNSIEKTLQILMAFTPYNQEMGAIEMSQKLGFSKSTVSRIMLNLTKMGFLHQSSRTKKYKLGPSVFKLGSAINRSLKTDLLHMVKPHADELRERLQETVSLEVPSGVVTVISYLALGPSIVRLAGDVGDMLPAHAAAGAKAILAFSPNEFIDRVLEKDLTRFTEKTITDPAEFRLHMQETKQRGYAIDDEEINFGVRGVGVPIFDYEGKPVAGLVVVGSSNKVSGDRNSVVVEELLKTAAKISSQLSYYVDDDE